MQFGRTDLADCSLDGDESMSRLHFAVDLQEGRCRIRDLGSRNGTYVNDQLVRMHLLSHGDRITAGKTEFEVVLEHASPANTESEARPKKTDSWNVDRLWAKTNAPSGLTTFSKDDNQSDLQVTQEFPQEQDQGIDDARTSLPRAITSPSSLASPKGQIQPDFFLESTMIVPSRQESETPAYYQIALSDTVLAYCGSPSQVRPIELGQILLPNEDALLLINVDRMDVEARSFFASSVHGRRFCRTGKTHILVSHEDGLDMLELFRRSWGRDAAILMLSQSAPSEIRQHIIDQQISFEGPSIFWSELKRSSVAAQESLLGPLDAVLLEDNGAYEWAFVYSRESGYNWQTLGLATPPLSKQ